MRIVRSLLMLTAAATYTASLLAQAPTGIISGTVTDSSGAVVPGASITITDKSTSSSRSVTTSADGLFSAPSLPVGTYEVRAEAQGFRTTVREANVEVGNYDNG